MAKKVTGPFSPELLDQLLDQLLAGRDPKSILESGGLIGELKKALADRMLNAEMDVHLDAEERQAMIDREHELPVVRQCQILELSRSSVYYLPEPVPAADLA